MDVDVINLLVFVGTPPAPSRTFKTLAFCLQPFVSLPPPPFPPVSTIAPLVQLSGFHGGFTSVLGSINRARARSVDTLAQVAAVALLQRHHAKRIVVFAGLEAPQRHLDGRLRDGRPLPFVARKAIAV